MIDRDIQPVALLDIDGTVANYNEALERDMNALRSPNEPLFCSHHNEKLSHIGARMDLIRGRASWWEDLERLPLGFEIYNVLLDWKFRVVVLTQGPKKNSEGWKGKLNWCRKNLSEDIDVIITRDKGLVYGKILVDDYPEYAMAWLKHRPRGLVIMPAQPWNEGFKHEQVIRYSGTQKEYDDLNVTVSDIYSQFKKDSINE